VRHHGGPDPYGVLVVGRGKPCVAQRHRRERQREAHGRTTIDGASDGVLRRSGPAAHFDEDALLHGGARPLEPAVGQP
jgi:hypothetical protein